MRLAGDRVLEHLAPPFAHALDVKRALHTRAFNCDLRPLESHDLERGAEVLPRHATELPVKIRPSAPTWASLVSARRRTPPAMAFVDGFRPRGDGRAGEAIERDVAARPFGDLHADQCLTASVLRIRGPAEVTAATEVTVAEVVAGAFECQRVCSALAIGTFSFKAAVDKG